MAFNNITLSLSEELIEYLNNISNKSEFVREALDEKIGRKDKSLTDIAIEITQEQLKLEALEKQYFELLNMVLGHKEDLRLSEIENLESKKLKQAQDNKDFLNKYAPIFNNYPELVNLTQEQLDDLSYLMPIVEKINKDGNRIGISQVRRYFVLKQ